MEVRPLLAKSEGVRAPLEDDDRLLRQRSRWLVLQPDHFLKLLEGGGSALAVAMVVQEVQEEAQDHGGHGGHHPAPRPLLVPCPRAVTSPKVPFLSFAWSQGTRSLSLSRVCVILFVVEFLQVG